MIILLILLRIAVFVLGASIAIGTFLSAIRTFVLPRGAPDVINRNVFIILRVLFDASFFRVSYNPNPSPTDPISLTRKEFDAACDELGEAEVPLKADREQAWRDFAGWRVNYDTVLIALAELMMAPPAPWSSDRRLAHAPVVSLRWSRRKLVEKHEWIPPSGV